MFGSNLIKTGTKTPGWRILCCKDLPTAIQSTKVISRFGIKNTLVQFPADFNPRDLLHRCRYEEIERCLASGACVCGNVIDSAVFVPKWSTANPEFTQRLVWQYRPKFVAHPKEMDVILAVDCPCHQDVEFVDVDFTHGDI